MQRKRCLNCYNAVMPTKPYCIECYAKQERSKRKLDEVKKRKGLK